MEGFSIPLAEVPTALAPLVERFSMEHSLYDASERPRVIGTIGASNVFSECHEGAIYLHRGRQYLVSELDRDHRRVRVRAVRAPYYTRALSDKETEILSRDRTRPAGNSRLVQGRLKVTTHLRAYERRRGHAFVGGKASRR